MSELGDIPPKVAVRGDLYLQQVTYIQKTFLKRDGS